MKNVIITISLFLLARATCARGAELLVPTQYPTIQSAIDAAADGDTVIVAPGTYTGKGNRDIDFLGKVITVRSTEGPETCIIDCNGSQNQPHTGFVMTAGTLAGVTITGSYSYNGGGAVTCRRDNSVKLIHCILTGNCGKRGGAILCELGSNVEIVNCSLTNNSAGDFNQYFGGAIFCEGGSVLVSNCTVSGNSAASGGGVYGAKYSNITLKDCVISENFTYPYPMGVGGGVYCEYGSITIIGSDISRNSSPSGAGIYCREESSVFISDCNIHHNVAEGVGSRLAGGGIYYVNTSHYSFDGLAFAVINSSITDNTIKGSEGKGGGLYIETSASSKQNVNILLTGCVVAHNSAQPSYKGSGGGLYCTGRVSLSETEVKENLAYFGGGIYSDGPALSVSRCRISGNAANDGSAAMCSAGEVIIENSLISGNRNLRQSGGLTLYCNGRTTPRISNCTIVGNSRSYFPFRLPKFSSSITNSIIYWNCRDSKNCYQMPTDISVSYCDIQGGYAGTGNIDADPCFILPGYWDTNGTPGDYRDDFWVEGDYRLSAVSPCIDSGGFAFLMDNKDLAGNPRIKGDAIDMGAYEYQNTPPVAVAGPNQTAYAWIDGFADVALDGSASYDDDNDVLDYYWSWTINGNDYEANGIALTIKLPVGKHTIELVVDDGIDLSEPDYCTITVISAVRGKLTITPRVIETKSCGRWILATLFIPSVPSERVNTKEPLRLYPTGIEAKYQRFYRYGFSRRAPTFAIAFFDKQQVSDALGTGRFEVSVVGEFLSGRYFFGSDTIKIIAPRPPRPKPPHRQH